MAPGPSPAHTPPSPHLDGLGDLNPLGDGHVTGVEERLALQHRVHDPLVGAGGAGGPAGGGKQARTLRPLARWPRSLLPSQAPAPRAVAAGSASPPAPFHSRPQEQGPWSPGGAEDRPGQVAPEQCPLPSVRQDDPGRRAAGRREVSDREGNSLLSQPAVKSTRQPRPRTGKQRDLHEEGAPGASPCLS